MAWVANRSTRVRKAMCPIRRLRAMTPNDDCGMAPSWELARAINALFACANWGLPLTSARYPLVATTHYGGVTARREARRPEGLPTNWSASLRSQWRFPHQGDLE